MTLSLTDTASQKSQMRLEMKARRALLNERERAHASWLLCDSLLDWMQNRSETRVAIYLARPFEISLDSLARQLNRAGVIVCAPRLDLPNERMNFYRLSDVDATARGPWGVREPISDEIVRPELVFAPGLAFDPIGHRLGTGGGWYDRVLADISLKVGVVFDGQIVNEVPIETHDIGMNWVASDKGIFACEPK